MKRFFFVVLISIICFAQLFSQSLLNQIGEDDKLSDTKHVDTKLFTDDVELFQYVEQEWNTLTHLDCLGKDKQSYLESLYLLLSTTLEQGGELQDVQHILLAECLFFSCFVEPSLKEDERVNANDLCLLVERFISELGSAALVPSAKSATVYSLFKFFAVAEPLPAYVKTPQIMPAFESHNLFQVPTEDLLAVELYRGAIALEKIFSDAPVSVDDKLSLAELSEEMNSYLIENIFSEPAVLYAFSNTSLGKEMIPALFDINQFLEKNIVYYCDSLLKSSISLGLTYGLPLLSVLPSDTAIIVCELLENPLMLLCLSQKELEVIARDLECLNYFVPVFSKRIISLLYVPEDLNSEVENG